MTKFLNHCSFNQEDDSILDQIAAHQGRLTNEQQAVLVITALYKSYEPCSVKFNYGSCPSCHFYECVVLLQQLSLPGKLALSRAILEHLAVAEIIAGHGEALCKPCFLPALARE